MIDFFGADPVKIPVDLYPFMCAWDI